MSLGLNLMMFSSFLMIHEEIIFKDQNLEGTDSFAMQ